MIDEPPMLESTSASEEPSIELAVEPPVVAAEPVVETEIASPPVQPVTTDASFAAPPPEDLNSDALTVFDVTPPSSSGSLIINQPVTTSETLPETASVPSNPITPPATITTSTAVNNDAMSDAEIAALEPPVESTITALAEPVEPSTTLSPEITAEALRQDTRDDSMLEDDVTTNIEWTPSDSLDDNTLVAAADSSATEDSTPKLRLDDSERQQTEQDVMALLQQDDIAPLSNYVTQYEQDLSLYSYVQRVRVERDRRCREVARQFAARGNSEEIFGELSERYSLICPFIESEYARLVS